MRAQPVKRAALATAGLIAACAVQVAFAADAARLAQGQQLFEKRCGVCHRAGQTGTQVLARRLGKERSLLAERRDLTVPYIRQVVRWGLVNMPRLTRVEMPDGDLDAIAAWLTRNGN
jgi:mono/diheme cytochrome c family protein